MFHVRIAKCSALIIIASFFAVAGSVAYAAGPTLVSARVTGSNTIVIVYSEPVSTGMGDYTNFTGGIGGAALVAVGGSGTNTITLTFSGTPFSAGSNGYISIGTGVYGISDSTYFSGGTFSVTNNQTPVLASVSATFVNVGNAFLGIGSTVTLNFTASESVTNPTVTIQGHTISMNGNGAGPYSVTYTLAGTDTTGALTATIAFTDSNGNQGKSTVDIGGASGSTASVNGYLNSNATTPGALGIGGSITFNLNLSTPEPNARVTGSYNGVPLVWYTTNNGTTYTATYVVTSGQTSQAYPLQISGVVLTDQYGNTSTPFAGSDVVKTISATGGSTGSVGGYITSNATAPGVLTIGSSITFTLVPSTPAPNGRVTGSYNGVPLAWYSTNGGVSYSATYTVGSGQANQPYPLQITGVMLTDQYNNSIGPMSGSDIVKTISTTPTNTVIYEVAPVPSVTTNPNPTYAFNSSEAGTIRYGGDCWSATTAAVTGTNTVTFNTLANGYHSNCTVTVADSLGNISNILPVTPFTVQAPSTVVTPPSTSSASTYQFMNFLNLGSKGTDVTQLQQRLTVGGFYTGPITGYFGPLTKAAVKRYQAQHGLSPVGYVGPGTRAALNQ